MNDVDKDIKKCEYIQYVITSLIFIGSFIISLAIVKSNSLGIKQLSIFEDGFIINAIIVILGFTVTIITFIYTGYERILKILYENELDEGRKMIVEISKEVKSDIYFIFRVLIIIIFAICIRNVDIPYLRWYFSCISKIEFIEIIKVDGLLLSFYSLWDLIKAVMKLIDINYFN